ncbi:MAG: GNAT family N-acetyltransferase, partial [Anaerolineales bacterium]|nr:GNAT family N-acetyltransferase [Anaerolineales bacterium]
MTLTLQTTPSHQLTPALRQEIIALCNRAYEEDLAELFATFINATHMLGYFENGLVSHALWVTRQLQVGSGPLLRTAYVELVATEPKYQQRGLATAV